MPWFATRASKTPIWFDTKPTLPLEETKAPEERASAKAAKQPSGE